MNELPPEFIRTPTPLAAALIALSVLPLPAESRDRWSDEYRAEIVGLHRTRQIAEAASAVAGSFALRSALRSVDSENVLVPTTAWSCRVGRHRYRTVNQDNPENRKYQHRECVICGKLKEGPAADFPRTDRPFMGGVSPLG
jgi:hypothetical protein